MLGILIFVFIIVMFVFFHLIFCFVPSNEFSCSQDFKYLGTLPRYHTDCITSMRCIKDKNFNCFKVITCSADQSIAVWLAPESKLKLSFVKPVLRKQSRNLELRKSQDSAKIFKISQIKLPKETANSDVKQPSLDINEDDSIIKVRGRTSAICESTLPNIDELNY